MKKRQEIIVSADWTKMFAFDRFFPKDILSRLYFVSPIWKSLSTGQHTSGGVIMKTKINLAKST